MMKKFIPQSRQQQIIHAYLGGVITLKSCVKELEKSCWSITDNTMQKLKQCDSEESKQLLDALKSFRSRAEVKGKPKQFLNLMVEKDLLIREAAEQMQISIETGNAYLAMLRRRFNCKTNVAMVYEAIRHGLIGE